MKAKTLFLTALLTLCAAILPTGCSKQEPTAPDAPLAPTSAQILAADDSSLTIRWTASADSTQITGYRVVRLGTGDSVVTDLPGTARSIRLTGLIRGFGYEIYIYAMRDKAVSAPLVVQWFGWMLPKPPVDINAVADGPTSAIVTWAAGDTAVTGYRLTWDGVTYRDSGAMDLPATATMARITNLKAGQQYNVWLSSIRGVAISPRYLFCLAFDDETPPPSSPLNLMAAPQSASTVGLRWTAAGDTGVVAYKVLYAMKGAGGYDSVQTSSTSSTISGLTPGTIYLFSVIAMRMGKSSPAVIVESAPATHYTTEPGSATPIRIYEKGSSNGAGLTLDPAKGGPKNVQLTIADRSTIQLAMFVEDQQSSFLIGPAYAFPELGNSDEFDHDVYISDSTYPAKSLDDWYYSGSITEKITDPNANLEAHRLPQWADNVIFGQGFFVRTGTAGNYHYARVFIRNNGGRLLQGTAPDRYVELEISW